MINLLPLRYKEQLKQEENRKLVLISGIIFLIFLISLILILFSIKLHIQGQLESVKVLADLEEKTMEKSEIQILKGKINLSNQNLSKLKSFYKKQVSSVDILEKIFNTVPAEIYLTAFSWQKNTSQVTISGFSPHREILFVFQQNLEQTEEFTEIIFPPQNWIKSTDIDFHVSFKIKN